MMLLTLVCNVLERIVVYLVGRDVVFGSIGIGMPCEGTPIIQHRTQILSTVRVASSTGLMYRRPRHASRNAIGHRFPL